MAIKQENKKLYPKNWKEISARIIKERGGCEICQLLKIKRNVHNTTHHKDRNPSNIEPTNLVACCPRHHFMLEKLINTGYFNPKQTKLF